jgi:hypothetical protein
MPLKQTQQFEITVVAEGTDDWMAAFRTTQGFHDRDSLAMGVRAQSIGGVWIGGVWIGGVWSGGVALAVRFGGVVWQCDLAAWFGGVG